MCDPLMRKTYAALQKANEKLAKANLKKHERLLVKQEHYREQALMPKGRKNFIKNTKKADRAGERAEGEHEKARKRTEIANLCKWCSKVRWLGILAVALWHHRVIFLGVHCIFQTLPMNCVTVVSCYFSSINNRLRLFPLTFYISHSSPFSCSNSVHGLTIRCQQKSQDENDI